MMTTNLLTDLEPSRLGALSRTPDGQRRLLAEALSRPGALRGLWEGYCAGAERLALPVDDSTPYLSLLAALADACLHAGEVLRYDLEDAGGGPDDLAALDGAAADLRAPRTTAEIRAALNAGECLTVEEAMADLDSAGAHG